jgi:alpha-L-fucosidase 2
MFGRIDVLRHGSPGREDRIIEEGLPIGNGRLGALVTCGAGEDALYLCDGTLWTGGANDEPGEDGQFPYDERFGTLTLLAKAYLRQPGHGQVSDYRRELDMARGCVVTTYTVDGVGYRREVFASHPHDVVVLRLTHSGGGEHTGGLVLGSAHPAETGGASFGGVLGNGLRFGAAVAAAGTGGTVTEGPDGVRFAGCGSVTIAIAGGTDYLPDAARGWRGGGDPRADARRRARAAVELGGRELLAAHTADHRGLYDRVRIDLGPSTDAQRAKDLPERLAAGGPDPELEAAYVQFGRYLLIAGSRDRAPIGLQGLWLDRPDPAWSGDYHTNINVQMNYWLPARAGLPSTFDAFTDFCLAQVSSWERLTREHFQDPRNGMRNRGGRVAGWTVATSANPHGGLGWRWNPAGGAWLCTTLFEHYGLTGDLDHLRRIAPLLRGACEFWRERLLEVDGELVAERDWSPEHGPLDALGITYAQELVWQLFTDYGATCAVLGAEVPGAEVPGAEVPGADIPGVDVEFAAEIAGLRERLHLPPVSATTGWLREWMTDDDLGEPGHRHLSGLVGFFPGDRITDDTGVSALLRARGMRSFGWACAWRALCWARLGDGEQAYRLLRTVLEPAVDHGNGTAVNLFDMYSFGDSSTFQIDANLGAATAVLEMLVRSRDGLVELLPALPAAWPSGSARGLGVRGGFTVDLDWRDGKVTAATLHSVGGTATTVRADGWTRTVTITPGGSVAVL